jgi:hypothetical protein
VTLSIEGAREEVIAPEIIVDLVYDGALNAAFINQYAVTLDLVGARAWWDAR